MRIGVVPVLNPSWGGTFQYSQTALPVIQRWVAANGDDVVVVGEAAAPEGGPPFGLPFVQVADPAGLGRQLIRLRRKIPRLIAGARRDLRPFGHDGHARQRLQRAGIDLLVCLYPTPIGFETGIACVMPVHDLQHRISPRFPEVGAPRERRAREYLYRNAARTAVRLIVDSQVGADDVVACYGDENPGLRERIAVVPFLPSGTLPDTVAPETLDRVRGRYGLPPRYLFYPAQFWEHKNHVRLVEAVAKVRDRLGEPVPLVLAGSHSGKLRERTFAQTMARVDELGIGGDVAYLGYVPDEDMAPLYRGAVALVFPTFFGPTNIPVVEAWKLGCPVLTSDIRGIREQVGDAGVLVDPTSVDAMADGIAELWSDEELAHSLIQRGRRRAASYTEADFGARLIDVLDRARAQVGAGITPA